MSVYYKGILPLASDLYRYITALASDIFLTETSPGQNNQNWPTERKILVMFLDHPGISGGESVCSVF